MAIFGVRVQTHLRNKTAKQFNRFSLGVIIAEAAGTGLDLIGPLNLYQFHR